MFDWIKLILLVLGIIDKWVDDARAKGLIDQGRDEEIARSTASILGKTKWANDLRERNAKLGSDEVDAALRELEPK
jgi:hypothetical protein